MKKNTSIIFLSIFALAMSVFGFMGIQPVKASTTLGEGEGAITVKDTDIQFKGASLDWAEEKFDEEKGITTSGKGRLKFYSSYSTNLITALEGKTYKLGTLVARAEDFASYEDVIVGAEGVIPVETTEYKKTYNSAWWTMVSVDNIPRAYYGVQLIARPYVEVDGKYAYAPYVEEKNYAYSLATTAQMKLDAGHFNVENTTDLTVTGTKVQETYTKFKVTVYYDPLRLEEKGWDKLPTREVDGTTYCYKEIVYNYGDAISNSQLYEATPLAGTGDTYYNVAKGFYNKERTANVHGINITLNSDSYTYEEHYQYLTKVYGDMTLYEVLGPSNLLDDFSTPASVSAAYAKTSEVASGTYNSSRFSYMVQDENAKWHQTAEDENGVTENGVIEIPTHFATDRGTESNRYFYFKSSIRSDRFFFNVDGTYSAYDADNPSYYTASTSSDYDYVNFRIMIKTTKDVEEVTLGPGGYSSESNGIYPFYDEKTGALTTSLTVPTNQWINVKLSRYWFNDRVDSDRTYATNPNADVRSTAIFYVNDGVRVSKGATAEEYQLYMDYMSYERDMRIAINGESGLVWEEKTVNDGTLDTRKFATYTKVTSITGEEIKLSTELTKYDENCTVKYSVVAPNDDVTALDGNTFTPTQIGTYKVIATCDDYLLQGGNRPGISKSYQYGEVTFESLGRDVNFNLTGADDLTAVQKGSTLNITNVTVDGLDVVADNLTYFIKAGEGEYEEFNGEFIASKTGNYSVIVKYNYNGAEFLSDAVEFTVVAKQIQLDAIFYVDGVEHDINNAILLDKQVVIKLMADGIEVSENVDYKVTHIDSTGEQEKNYEFNSSSFVAGFIGEYQVVINYTEDGESYTYKTTLAVVANTYENARYAETYSDSSSVYSAWLLDKNNTDNASIPTANKKDYTKYYAPNEAEGIYGTKWHREVTDINGETKYGVISTTPQMDYVNTNYGTTRLGIHLRSTEYRSTAEMEAAGLAKTVYDTDTVPVKANAAYAGINSDKWDYISVWVYFPKADAQPGETIKVGGFYNSQQFEVPFNTWYELRIDKPRMMFSWASEGNVFDTIAGSSTDAKPLFCLAYDAATAQQYLNQVVYIDSISFQQYEGYERFSELYLYDTVNEKAITKDVVNTVEYVGETATAEFNIVAKIPSESGIVDVDYSKMMTKVGVGNINKPYDYFTMTTKNDEPVKLQNSIYDDEGDDGIYNIKIATVKASNYIALCLTYYDEATDKNYLGWIHIKFNVAQKAQATT